MCTRGVPGGKRSNRVKHIMFLPGDTNVHTGCTRCVPRVFFRWRRRFNDFRPLFLSKICQNLSKFVKKFVKICQNLSKFVKICQNLSKFVKNCPTWVPFFDHVHTFILPDLSIKYTKNTGVHTLCTPGLQKVSSHYVTLCVSAGNSIFHRGIKNFWWRWQVLTIFDNFW